MSSKRDEIMREAGYIPAAKAAEVTGVTVQTIHRMVRDKRVDGTQVTGRNWYVRVSSLAEAYASIPQVRDRILATLITAT